jgi:hypothetical protein
MTDIFNQYDDSLLAPAMNAFAISPHDINGLQLVTKAIYVGSGGNVTLRPAGSNADVTYFNVPSGSYLTVRASYVRATGTTASQMVGEA